MHRWWRSDPRERLWLESTDRLDLGANLHAPQTDDSGAPNWRYTLLREVQEGDVVYHWNKREEAIVAYSTVSGVAESSPIVWAARGSYARSKGTVPHERPGYLVPLANFTRIDPVISLADVREQTPQLRAMMNALESQYGKPLYFPFELSETRPARTLQGYMFKLPAAFPTIFSGAVPMADPTPTASGGRRTARGQGFMASAEHKAAVELRAMSVAQTHFESLGYTVADTSSNNPFDLLAEKDGERLYVEVKGSTGDGKTVFLTRNEVSHAHANAPNSVLVVVANIILQQAAGEIEAVGGSLAVHRPWAPAHADLVAERYTYRVPPAPG
jgi:hypothetical protein